MFALSALVRSFSSVHPLSFYLPLSLLPPAQESISAGSISWHEYSLPAESLVGERRRLRLRRRQWRRGEGWGRRRERETLGERRTCRRRGSDRAHGWNSVASSHRADSTQKQKTNNVDIFFGLRRSFGRSGSSRGKSSFI